MAPLHVLFRKMTEPPHLCVLKIGPFAWPGELLDIKRRLFACASAYVVLSFVYIRLAAGSSKGLLMKPFHVVNFSEIGSTNERVKAALASGHTEGYVVRAQVQTGGYGRQGRLWTSPEGGLYQSMLLRPKCDVAQLPTLGFVMALSIRAALLRLASLPHDAVRIKWPNDVLVGDDKIAGISMEVSSGGVCMGMGVNVFHPAETSDLLFDGRYQPAFFSDMAVGYTEQGQIAFGNGYTFDKKQDAIAAVGDAIISAFAQCYPVWLSNGFAPFKREFVSCSYLMGKKVSMQLLNGDVIVEGLACGVDDNGCLLVDDGTTVHAVNSGEAHVIF